MKNKIFTIAQWFFAAIILILAVSIEFSLATVLLILAAVLLAPIKPIRKFLEEKLKIKSFVPIILSIVIFLVGVMVSPTDEAQQQTDGGKENEVITQNSDAGTSSTSEKNSVGSVESTNASAQDATTTTTITSTTTTTTTTTEETTKTTKSSTTTKKTTTTAKQTETGHKIYVTKSGKKYHYDSNCNGGTYYESTLQKALDRGLTPCNKCVY